MKIYCVTKNTVLCKISNGIKTLLLDVANYGQVDKFRCIDRLFIAYNTMISLYSVGQFLDKFVSFSNSTQKQRNCTC